MEKRRFVEIGSKGIDREKDVGKKFVNVGVLEIFFGKKEQKITQADMAAYATEILGVVKKYIDNSQSDLGISFLVHSLSADKLFADLGFTVSNFYYPDKEVFEEDVDVALNRLRAGLVEEIKKQLSANEEFADIIQNDIFMKNFSIKDTGFNSEVGQVDNLKGDKFYFKRLRFNFFDRDDLAKLNTARLEFFAKAQGDKDGGVLPPCILLPSTSSPESTELISVKREMFVLDDLVDQIKINKESHINFEKTLEDFALAVEMILDAARACGYIQEKGFVLMDVDRYNIGYDLKDKHGMVFDWDMMAKIGDETSDRVHKPNLFKYDKFHYGRYADPQEMVFQLGVTLKEVAMLGRGVLSDQVSGELYALSLVMVEFDGRKESVGFGQNGTQPNLKEVARRLEAIHKEI